MRPLPSTTRGGYERNRPTNWGIHGISQTTTYLYGLEEGVERTERTKKPPNKEGCMLPTMPLGKKKVENSQRFPTGIPCSKAHPGTDSSTQALVLVGNKWTADALSEIGVSTQAETP